MNLKKPEFNFLFLFIPSILLWFFFYHYLYKIDGFLNLEIDLLTSFSSLLSYQSNTLLSFFKFKTTTEIHGDMVITKILDYPYSHGVWIGEPCNGIKVFGLFRLEGVTEIDAFSSGAIRKKLPGALFVRSTDTTLDESESPSAV